MPMDLYTFAPSPSCRSVSLLAKRMGIEFNIKTINIMAGEHLSPEFIKV
jgi:glutathione S-transferase